MKTKSQMQPAGDISPPSLLPVFFYQLKSLIMKKSILLTIAVTVIFFDAQSQITKGNWMMGGNASFSFTNYETNNSKLSEINLSPNIGYFVADKLAAGIRASYFRSSNKFGEIPGQPGVQNSFKSSSISIGPFIRYYFLPIENQFNILTELNYQYLSSKQEINNVSSPNSTSNRFSIAAGPAIYLNSSVGLEFLINYSATPKNSSSAKSNKIGFGIGFQIHLEKEKS